MNYDPAQLMRLAASPAGQQLLAYLKNSSGDKLEQLSAMAARGDWEGVSQWVSVLLDDPKARELLRQLEGQS